MVERDMHSRRVTAIRILILLGDDHPNKSHLNFTKISVVEKFGYEKKCFENMSAFKSAALEYDSKNTGDLEM